jgi:hypothetical protein
MTYVERLLGEQGQAYRRLGEEILQRRYLEVMHAAASQPRASMNVYGSTCPFCCGDVDAAGFLKTGVAACLFCHNKELAVERPRSRWTSLQVASTVASRFAQGQAQRAPE